MNEGNGYDDRTEVFTCPMAGTYKYKYGQFKTQQEKSSFASCECCQQEVQGSYLQMSRKVGDHVKVVSGGNVFFITSDNYSGFTGTFLF